MFVEVTETEEQLVVFSAMTRSPDSWVLNTEGGGNFCSLLNQ